MTIDELVQTLSGAGQVSVAITLIKRSLPLWEAYVQAHPAQLAAVSALIDDQHRVRGGGTMLCPGLLAEVVERIEKDLAADADLQRDPILRCYLATVMGPLTNPGWGETLVSEVRFIYAAVYNLLVALVSRRLTADHETHISVAINHACSALLAGAVVTETDLGLLMSGVAASVPPDARDPLVTDANPEIESALDGDSQFLTAIRREHLRCPRCSSTRVRQEAAGFEFTKVECEACGNDDLADGWQMDDWYV
jgi:hypothetical protein